MSNRKQVIHLAIYFVCVGVALGFFGAPTWAVASTLFILAALFVRIRFF